jgi:riboflavin synthase
MNIKYVIYSIEEIDMVCSVSLSSSGLSTEEEYIQVRIYEAEFDNKGEALKWLSDATETEHGYELVEIYKKAEVRL